MTTTPVRDKAWQVLHEAFERVARTCGEPVVLSTLAHEPGGGHPHTEYPFVLGPPGRLVAIAVGLRAALPDHPLLLVGAADAFTIGTNHLIHAARRNIGVTLVLLRADVLEASEPADRAAPLFFGVADAQISRPLDWAAALGATFVGRASLHDVDALAELVEAAVRSRGFSVIGVTNDPALPAGVLSHTDWPEFFDNYRSWGDQQPTPRAIEQAPARPDPAPGAPSRAEVRISGLGGQGVKLAGTVLSEALGAEGLWATQIGDYGSATRGGASSVDVVFGAEPITYPGADHPDAAVVLSQKAADSVNPNARLIVSDARLTAPAGAVSVPIVDLAREHTGGQLSAGIVALGVIAALVGWPSIDSLAEAATEKLPARVAGANVEAMRAAYALGCELVEKEGR